jgi:hypothetical protein
VGVALKEPFLAPEKCFLALKKVKKLLFFAFFNQYLKLVKNSPFSFPQQMKGSECLNLTKKLC